MSSPWLAAQAIDRGRHAAPRRRRGVAGETRELPRQARLREDRRAQRRDRSDAVTAAALRDPEARRPAAALRSAPRTGRRLQVLGGDARPIARSRTTSAWRSRSRIIRSTTAISKARSPKASTAAAPSSSGIAAIGSPTATGRPSRRSPAGDLKFTLEGERLHGSWVLVRHEARSRSAASAPTGC